MKRVSKLSIIFRDELRKLDEDTVVNLDVIIENKASSDNESDNLASLFTSLPSSSFQMPLHYPNYTKEEYEIMSEEEIDRLLKLYGMPIDIGGDLSFKREFAVGAFLWDKELNLYDENDSVNPNSSSVDLDQICMMGFMTGLLNDMVHFLFRI